MSEWYSFIEAMLTIGFYCVYVFYNVFAEHCEGQRKYRKVRSWNRSAMQKDYK
jgi:hypothetical protein